MQPLVSPITCAAEIVRDDLCNYVQSIIPPVPCIIESLLGYHELKMFECHINASLENESDCSKWVTTFEEKTDTCWKAVSHNQCQMIYKLKDSSKGCHAKLEMQLFSEVERIRNRKQYPCQVYIIYYSSPKTTQTLLHSQHIPSYSKQGFEGLEGYLSLSGGPQSGPEVDLDEHQVTISSTKEEPVMSVVSQKLDNMVEVLGRMLHQTGRVSRDVKHFVDMFEKLQGDENKLGEALSSFGGMSDRRMSSSESLGTAAMPPHQALSLSNKETKLDEKEDAVLSSGSKSVVSSVSPGKPQHQAGVNILPKIE